MSEHLLTVLLSDLSTVRIVCQHKGDRTSCGVAVEVPVEKLGQLEECPVCHTSFDPMARKLYISLGRAITQLQAHKGVQVEFVVREQGESP
jgi:hypothetical protein